MTTSVFILVILGVALAERLATWHTEDRRAQIQVEEFLQALTEQSTKTDVQPLVDRYDSLASNTPELEDTWAVQTPLRFDAENWVVWIDFMDDRVARVRVRIYDNAFVRPEAGPPDVVFVEPEPQ